MKPSIRRSWVFREWVHFRKNGELFFLALPAVVYKLIFSYAPLFFIILAFKNYRYDLGVFGSKWVGFKNFDFFSLPIRPRSLRGTQCCTTWLSSC